MGYFMLDIFSKVINEVLFGNKETKKIHGMSVPMAVDELHELLADSVIRHPLNSLTGGLLGKFKLIEPVKKAWALGDEIKEAITDEYLKRLSESQEDFTGNILDLVVKHNKSAPESEKLPISEVVGNCVFIKLASVDTARNATQFTLNHFMADQKSRDWFQTNIVDQIPDSEMEKYETYEQSKVLDRFTREMLRLYNPLPILTDRIATKTFKVGKYKIHKGDILNFNIHGLHHNTQYFDRPMELDFERTQKELVNGNQTSKSPYMPFITGKRNCIGRFLGELMVQLVMVHIFKRLELKEVKNLEYGATFGPTYSPQFCYARVKPRH